MRTSPTPASWLPGWFSAASLADGAASLGWRRGWTTLGALAGGMELVYLLYFLRQFPLLRYYRRDLSIGDITQHGRAAMVVFVLTVSLLFALFALACLLASRLIHHRSLWPVLAIGALFGVTLTFVYPITSTDLFSYINQSRILVHYHQNPLVTPPAAFPHDPLMYRPPTWRMFPAPYGPVGVTLDAVPSLLAGNDLLVNLVLL